MILKQPTGFKQDLVPIDNLVGKYQKKNHEMPFDHPKLQLLQYKHNVI